MSYFPLPKPRKNQEVVIREIDKVFKSGKKVIILEAPVGSGKSPIAMTFALASGDAHIITPRKSLQDQYHEDFSKDVVLMKGRNAYPCTFEALLPFYRKVTADIRSGMVRNPAHGEDNCATAPCRNNETIWKSCIENGNKPCPYQVAIEVAQGHEAVVHNIHSFIFQTKFGGKFERRKLLVVDEAHEIENAIRGFITKKVSVNVPLQSDDVPTSDVIGDWCDFLRQDRFVPQETQTDYVRKMEDESYESEHEKYLSRIEVLRESYGEQGKGFTVKRTPVMLGNTVRGTSFEFIPHSIGLAAQRHLFDYGEQVLLMSGTIYDKDLYCRCVGLNPADVHFIRIPSSFPIQNRPIYLKKAYQVDTSHRNWNDNFGEMVEKIQSILGIFSDVKGLIHVPSYDAMYQIADAVVGGRVVVHDRHDLSQKLQEFYASTGNGVFISPICQQGVDFKGDRARFQIVTRVPYANTSDEFMSYKVQNDFNWYNYQALITFGQMIGRVNRSDDDFGATFLLDERFTKFVGGRNAAKLPKWLRDAFIFK